MSADAEIKAFVERVLRLKEEQDTLGEDIREVYAEAKGRGYDKTVLGNVVSHLRKVAKLGHDTLSEREAIFDLYLTAYETVHRAPASARTRENIEQFPSKDLSSLTAANAGGDDVNSTRGAGSNDGHQVETGGESAATNSPETANETRGEEPGTATSENTENAGQEAITANVATLVEPESSAEAKVEGQPSVTLATSAKSAADERNVEATVEQRSSATNSTPAFRRHEVSIRPHCQHPGACAGYGSNHCYACKKQMAEVG